MILCLHLLENVRKDRAVIKITDKSVHDDIHEILLDEYVELLEMYETLERNNELAEACVIVIAMDEIDSLSCKLLGYAISPFALKCFQ